MNKETGNMREIRIFSKELNEKAYQTPKRQCLVC